MFVCVVMTKNENSHDNYLLMPQVQYSQALIANSLFSNIDLIFSKLLKISFDPLIRVLVL